jgi:sec-independent protein translocase protein TatA
MSSIGFKEIIVILLVILIIFGGKRLPELGRGLGKGLSNFRKAMADKTDSDDQTEVDGAKAERPGPPKA